MVYTMKTVSKADFNKPEQTEVKALLEKDVKKRKELLEEALSGFKSLETAVDTHPRAKRYAAFRIARCKAYLAHDDKAQRKEAVEGLLAYRKAYPDGWGEILQVIRHAGPKCRRRKAAT